MSQACVFVDIDGNTSVQQSLSDSKLFSTIKGFMPNAQLLFCYMDWRLYGVLDDDEKPNDVATEALRKLCKKTDTRLHGAVAFCFRSSSSKAYEMICCE